MEKTIEIDGKFIPFKSSGAVAMRYKAQFGKDFFASIMKLKDALPDGKEDELDITKVDFEVFYEIAWVFAKTADRTILDPLTWLDTFETFPIVEILPELQELIFASIQTSKKK